MSKKILTLIIIFLVLGGLTAFMLHRRVEEKQEVIRRARITTMKSSLAELQTIIIIEERPLAGANFCVNAEVENIKANIKAILILDEGAGTVDCFGVIDSPATCIQVDGVIKADENITTLCGDWQGNIYLGGTCQVPLGADPGAILTECRL